MTKGLATLSINLEARLAELQGGFDKAARAAEKNAATIEARYAKVASAAVAVGAAIAGAFTVGQLATFFRTTVDGIDALNDLADATGASIENISALEDAAARTGTSLDTVGSAMVKLNQVLQGAREGSAAAEALERIGLNAAELRRLDPAIALQRTAVALAGFANDGNKARLVQELFGKSVREVAPLLNDLAESGELVATVTAEQAEAASKFNKQLAALSKEATDLARDLSGPLVKGLNDFFDAINRARRSDDGLLGSFGKTLQADFLRARLVATNEEIENLSSAAQRAQDILARQPDSIRAKATLAEFAALQRAADEYRRKIDQVMGYAQGSRRPANEGGGRVNIALPSVGDPENPAGRTRGTAARATDFAGTPLDPLTVAALKRLENTDTARLGQLRLELQALLEVGGETDAGNQGDALRKIRAEIALLDPEQVKLAANRQRLNELLSSTPSGQLGGVLTDIQLINGAFDDGRITVEQWAELVRSTTARLPQDTERALNELSEFTRQFQSNVQNVLGDNIASVLRGDFDSIEDAWKTMLLNMIAQATAADLATRLFGADGRGGWLAQLGGFLGFAKGGAFSQGQPITAFADGGVLTKPTFFGMGGGRMGVAGEAGYEGILPLRRGPGGRLGVEAYGGGGTTNVYNVAAGIGRAELISALQLVQQQTKADVMSELRARRVI